MARSRKSTPTEPRSKKPKPIAETLETLKEQISTLQTAAELPPPEQEVVPPPPNTDRPSFVQKLADRPAFAPVPEGFMNVARHETAGIRVNKSLDKRIAAIQFAEDRLPTRAEKDILEAFGQAEDQKFTYRTATRQWERQATESYGANIIETNRIAGEMAKDREGKCR